MSAGKLRYTLVVRHPDTGAPAALLEGDEVPDWASDLVQDDDLVSGDSGSTSSADSEDSGSSSDSDDSGADAPVAWSEKTVDELKTEIANRNEARDDDAKVPATGNKADLVAALTADDAAQAS